VISEFSSYGRRGRLNASPAFDDAATGHAESCPVGGRMWTRDFRYTGQERGTRPGALAPDRASGLGVKPSDAMEREPAGQSSPPEPDS
jgi:hypothetical protein